MLWFELVDELVFSDVPNSYSPIIMAGPKLVIAHRREEDLASLEIREFEDMAVFEVPKLVDYDLAVEP